MQETLIKINRGGLPPFSARGCTQILKPLKTGELRRTVNGELCYLGRQHHHKYMSEIFCKDKTAPAFEGFWRGEEVLVSCLQRVCQEIQGDGQQKDFQLDRVAVEGSEQVILATGKKAFLENTFDQGITLKTALEKSEKAFISYRPLLKMRITLFSLETDEWSAKVGWRLVLEEI